MPKRYVSHCSCSTPIVPFWKSEPHICTSPRARTTLSQVVFGACWNCRAFQQNGNLLLGEALDTRARARGRATRWKGSMPALAREPLIRVCRSFFASVRAIRNRVFPGARRFRGRSTADTAPEQERGSARRPPYGGGGPAGGVLLSCLTPHSTFQRVRAGKPPLHSNDIVNCKL